MLARSGVMHVSACSDQYRATAIPFKAAPVSGQMSAISHHPALGAGSRATDDCAAFRVGDRLDDLVGGDAGGVVEAA